jgi:hypothetical protein
MECQQSAHQAAQEGLVASLSWMTPRMTIPVFIKKDFYVNPV